ncbi:MAG: DUF5063 domain-containing protein [Actinomycetota bacterium]|jgi:hypothetical protein|nr:DUF5063 domain-containing protein [Actinomycetota bacterium]
MSRSTTAGELEAELAALAEDTAREARTYLVVVREVAGGQEPETALPMLLLAASQVQLAGARLGAMVDVVPPERFEADAGPEADLDTIRAGLRQLLGGVDEYLDLPDPVVSGEVAPGSLADDLAAVVADLQHGLRHHQEGRLIEALWWWQFSYLSSWGERCAAAIRVLHGLLAHLRLDADEETVMEAELAALHAGVEDETI